MLSALAVAALLSSSASAKGSPIYDPEIALLLLTVQKQSVGLVREEMLRQAEWLNLGAMQVLLPEQIDNFAAAVRKNLTIETDVVDEYRSMLFDHSPNEAAEAEKLINEIRRYHGLIPGPPLQPVALTEKSPEPVLDAQKGPGADAESALEGTPALKESVAYAERRFGSTGPFLRRRLWSLDFYLGSFADLGAHYKKLGYRQAYRLRAPYVSFGRSAYVLSPEPGLRPRFVFCEFDGRDLFLHSRAQWAVLTAEAKGQGPEVRTLSCPTCRWTLPGVRAMQSLLKKSSFTADWVVVGYEYMFSEAWKDQLLGAFENEFWRVAFYRNEAGTVAVVQSRHVNFGEILPQSLEAFVRRGARGIFYGGPAAVVDDSTKLSDLVRPSKFLSYMGSELSFHNDLPSRRGRDGVIQQLPSPLLATKEWLAGARARGVIGVDGETVRLVELASHWTRADGSPVLVGIGVVLGGLQSLHPEEDRAFYTVEYANQVGRESAKKDFKKGVFDILSAAARDKNP